MHEKYVVYATNGNDIRRLNASIFSLKHNCPDVKAVVLTYLPAEKFTSADIVIDPYSVFTPLKCGVPGGKWGYRWPFATLYRLAIPLLPLFQDVSRVVYLDTDTLVMSDELNCLFDEDESTAEILGVAGMPRLWMTSHKINSLTKSRQVNPEFEKFLDDNLRRVKGTDKRAQVNAGVLVWNLKQIRANGLDLYKTKVVQFFRTLKYHVFEMLDQDFVNLYMDTFAILDPRFNHWRGGTDKFCVVKHYAGGKSKSAIFQAAKRMGWEGPQ